MSRYQISQIYIDDKLKSELQGVLPELEVGVYDFCYGYDHAVFYFYQFFDGNGELPIDKDGLFNGVTGAELGTILKALGLNKHSTLCFLDLEI